MQFNVGRVTLQVSPLFLVIAILAGWLVGRQVASTELIAVQAMPDPMDYRAFTAWLDDSPWSAVPTHPTLPWVLVAGFGVAFVYFLSVLAHELGHLAVARALGFDVDAIVFDFAGGFVEIADEDRPTAGKLAAIVGAGPLVTAVLAYGTWATLRALEWPLIGSPDLEASASVAAGAVLSAAFVINCTALVVNLLPFRILDGGQLLVATRMRIARGW